MRKLELIIPASGGTTVDYNQLNFDQPPASTNDNYVDLGTVLNNGRTIEFFMTLNSTVQNSDTVIGRNATGGKVFINFNGAAILQALVDNGTGLVMITSDSAIIVGTEYHIVLRMDSVDNMRLIIDGVPQISSNPLNTPFSSVAGIATMGNFPVLNIRYSDVTIRQFNVWSTARTIAEIATDISQLPAAGTIGLIESYPFIKETGFVCNGVNGGTITINTSNAGGVTYVDSTVREDYQVTTGVIPIETLPFDLYDKEIISPIYKGIDVNNLSERSGGTTNNFTLPDTANNNNILDFLDLVGNNSNFPYQNNFVKYTDDSVELISLGRLNVYSKSNKGYDTSITHGVNGFFDLLVDKFLWEAYKPFQAFTPQLINAADIANSNVPITQLNSGFVIPLIDTAGINPIQTWKQIPHFVVKFGFEKICSEVGYTFTNIGKSLDGLVLSAERGIDIRDVEKSFTGVLNLNGSETIRVFSYVVEKESNNATINFNFIITAITGFLSFTGIAKLNGVTIFSSATPLPVVGGSVINDISPPFSVVKGDVIECFFQDVGNPPANNVTFDYEGCNYFQQGTEILDYEFCFGKLTQLNFIKEISNLFNYGIEIDNVLKTFTLFDQKDVQTNEVSSQSAIIDLSQYFDNTQRISYKSDYGKINDCSYNYEGIDISFADDFITANNVFKQKDKIESAFTASLNSTILNINGLNVELTKIVNAFDEDNPNNIGYRINRLLTFPTTGTFNVIQPTGVAFTYINACSTLDFSELYWQILIQENYSNLEDNILNSYKEFTLSMKVPTHIIRSFKFRNKIFIRELSSNFIVSEISVLENGLSEWKLIKIN